MIVFLSLSLSLHTHTHTHTHCIAYSFSTFLPQFLPTYPLTFLTVSHSFSLLIFPFLPLSLSSSIPPFLPPFPSFLSLFLSHFLLLPLQASLILARLWSSNPQPMGTDDLNQYLGWTIAQLSRNVRAYMYVHVQCTCTHIPYHSLTLYSLMHQHNHS